MDKDSKKSKEEVEAEQWVKDEHYKQDRKEYLDKVAEDQKAGGRNAPAVPKSMLERDYDKNPSGNYTIKDRGYKEHR